MRDPLWKRLGLDEDDWRECRASAFEMSLASGTRVSPAAVAVEFAMARSFDETLVPQELPHERAPRPARGTLTRR